MSKKTGNLLDVLSGVISGVLDGSIEPHQANAINGTVSQIIKIAKLKIEHGKTKSTEFALPQSRPLRSLFPLMKRSGLGCMSISLPTERRLSR